MPGQLLIVFAKAPRPGFVKTRIAKEKGADFAVQVHQVLVSNLLRHLYEIVDLEMRFSPDDALDEVKGGLMSRWMTAPQGDGDLGARLSRAFADAFSSGWERVVIIGSDCPEMTSDDVRDAWAALEENDVVIGPATDGGYWLIGLKSAHAELFEGITWSSSEVFAQTMSIARERQLKVAALDKLTDIDTFEDWSAYLARQESRGSRRLRRR